MPKTAVSKYELMLLLSPSLSEMEMKDHLEIIKKDRLAPLGGEIVFEDLWGKKRLAYPIRKEESAWYVLLNFTAGHDKLADLDEELRLDALVIRHLLLKTEKDYQAKTFAEVEAWNREHLPKEDKRKPEEKRAAFRNTKKPADVVAPVLLKNDLLADIEEITPDKVPDELLGNI